MSVRFKMNLKLHTVIKGETLTAVITKYYGAFDTKLMKMVMAVNGIADPDKIKSGSMLKLPGNWGGRPSFEPDITDIRNNESSVSTLNSQSKVSDTPTYKKNSKASDVVMKSKELALSDYWKELFHKNLVVLHFTTGYTFDGAYRTFLGKGRVATSFVVDTDGTIYRLYDERYWSYHLGIKGKDSENSYHEKRSIGIELVNPGPVWYVNGKWIDWWQLKSKKGRTYDESQVVVGKNRDADGMVKFPELQTDAVFSLVNWLLTKYDIKRQAPADFCSFQLPALRRFEGVVSHQIFRRDKYDVGPAFPAEKMIEACGLSILE